MSWIAIISSLTISMANPGLPGKVEHSPVLNLSPEVCAQMQRDLSGVATVKGNEVRTKVRCYDNGGAPTVLAGPPVGPPVAPPVFRNEEFIQDDLVPVGPEVKDGYLTGRPQFEIVPHMPDPVDRLGRR